MTMMYLEDLDGGADVLPTKGVIHPQATLSHKTVVNRPQTL